MIPALPPTRSLDLLILLDNAFATTPALHTFPAFYLAKTSQKAVRATRTMLEWLSQDITLQDHPLDFKHIKLVTEYTDLAQDPGRPRLVIVDDLNMSAQSFSKQTFLDFNSIGNLIVFTSRSTTENSLPSVLLSQWEMMSPSLSTERPRPIVSVSLTTEIAIEHREPLVGEDLVAWRRADRLSREQKDADLFFEERTRNLLEGTESDSDEEEEDQLLLDDAHPVAEDQQRTLLQRGSAVLLQEGTFDFWLGGEGGALRTGQRQYPFIDRRRKGDEFGGTLKPEEFVRVEEEALVVPVVKKTVAREVGGKRRWEEVEVEQEGLPSRVQVNTRTVDIHVRVGYVDLEGLHDGRAVGNLLPRLNTRKMVSSTHVSSFISCLLTLCAV
jgi:cleavage and polyadenylation specificity factor subunit 2